MRLEMIHIEMIGAAFVALRAFPLLTETYSRKQLHYQLCPILYVCFTFLYNRSESPTIMISVCVLGRV